MHIFFIHKPYEDNKGLIESARALYKYMKDCMGQIIRLQITLSLSDWDRYFDGDWDGWANSVINRRNAISRERVYDTYITETIELGRANYLILQRALGHNCPVYYWSGEDIIRIYDINLIDESNYQHTADVIIPQNPGIIE